MKVNNLDNGRLKKIAKTQLYFGNFVTKQIKN